MSRRLLSAALAALLTTSGAFAADNTSLTIYHADNDALFSGGTQGTLDAGHALVHETRKLDMQAGSHELRIGGLPATLDPEAISVGFDSGPAVTVLGQRVALANGSASGALDGAIGQHVAIVTASGHNIEGTLIGASGDGLLVRTDTGQLGGEAGRVVLVRDYESVALAAGTVTSGSSLLLDVDSKAPGTRHARLTYTTSGLGWRAAYSATLAGGTACRMRFKPEASIANRSGRDYRDASIKLVAGQPNLGNHGIREFSSMPAPMAASARKMPQQASLGDYRSFTLPGAVNLPNGTVTLTPLYPAQNVSCARQYIVEDGNAYSPPRPQTSDYGAQDYQDRAITSTLFFTAPEVLPAGTLRAWITDRDGAPALLGEGDIADTPKGNRVSVQLGQSFDLRASRERTAFHVDIKSHTMREAYKFTLTNGGDTARTVTVREHPSRWREWTLTSSSIKPSKRTPQLLEFEVPVPAHGESALEYAVRYTWTAQDMK